MYLPEDVQVTLTVPVSARTPKFNSDKNVQ